MLDIKLLKFKTTVMAKRTLLTIATLFLVTSFAFGQLTDPVSWSFKTKKVSADEFELIFNARIDDGWHLYSQEPLSDGHSNHNNAEETRP